MSLKRYNIIARNEAIYVSKYTLLFEPQIASFLAMTNKNAGVETPAHIIPYPKN